MGVVPPLNPEVIRGSETQDHQTTGLWATIPMIHQGVMMEQLRILLVSALVMVSAVSLVSTAGPLGQGPGFGTGPGFSITIPEPTDYAINDTEIADLFFMREEEQMAHDLYAEWSGKYGLPIFEKIAQAEEIHASEVQFLLDRYSLTSQRIGNLSTGYEHPAIRELSGVLAEQGNVSQTDALRAGVMIEEQDISDLDKALANTTRKDLMAVYGNLRSGSENHLSAFHQQLS